VGAIHRVTMTSFRSISMPAGFRRHLVGKLSEMFLTVMGVNATGTLAGRRSSAEDARIEAHRRRGGGVWGVVVPLFRKFMNFSSQNGVIRCILGVLFFKIYECGIQKSR